MDYNNKLITELISILDKRTAIAKSELNKALEYVKTYDVSITDYIKSDQQRQTDDYTGKINELTEKATQENNYTRVCNNYPGVGNNYPGVGNNYAGGTEKNTPNIIDINKIESEKKKMKKVGFIQEIQDTLIKRDFYSWQVERRV